MEYREDGWPLCPTCGADELWSSLQWDGEGERPPLEDYIKAGLTCYLCHWTNMDTTTTPREQFKAAVEAILTEDERLQKIEDAARACMVAWDGPVTFMESFDARQELRAALNAPRLPLTPRAQLQVELARLRSLLSEAADYVEHYGDTRKDGWIGRRFRAGAEGREEEGDG